MRTSKKVMRIKEQVRERDGHECVDCGKTQEEHIAERGKILHVHRLKPGSKYTVRGCVTTCVPCHGARHRPALPQNRQTTKMVGIHIEDWKRLEALALAQGRTVAYMARLAVRAGLPTLEKT